MPGTPIAQTFRTPFHAGSESKDQNQETPGVSPPSKASVLEPERSAKTADAGVKVCCDASRIYRSQKKLTRNLLIPSKRDLMHLEI